MADDADRAQEAIERTTEDAIRAAAKPIEPGQPGECELCGDWNGRLVRGACSPCRDRYGLA